MNIAEKLQAIAENEQKVYAAGESSGYAKGKTEGNTQGGKAEYDRFWDNYQLNGKRTQYSCAFGGEGWNKETFKPKYDIVPSDCYMMFRYFNYSSANEPIDLVELLDGLGVKLDFSKYAGTINYMFQQANISRVGVCDFSNRNAIENPFNQATELVTIDKMILKSTVFQLFYTPFLNCTKLKNITIEGVIFRSFNIQYSSLLTVDSAKSIINALNNYVGTTSEGAYALTFHADVWARLEAERPRDDGLTWEEYVGSLGWTT